MGVQVGFRSRNGNDSADCSESGDYVAEFEQDVKDYARL
jgi:hypothetical protein